MEYPEIRHTLFAINILKHELNLLKDKADSLIISLDVAEKQIRRLHD